MDNNSNDNYNNCDDDDTNRKKEKRKAIGQLLRTEQNSCVGRNGSPGGGQLLVWRPKLLLGLRD